MDENKNVSPELNNDNSEEEISQEKKDFRRHLLLITYAVALFVFLWNLGPVCSAIGHFFLLLSPLFWGIVIAYLLNVFLQVFEGVIFAPWWRYSPRAGKHKRQISVLIVCIIVFIILVLLGMFIIPQLWQSVVNVITNLSTYSDAIYKTIDGWINTISPSSEFNSIITQNWDDIITQTENMIPKLIDNGYQFVLDVGNSIINIFLGLIIAIYFLLSKEKIAKIFKKLIYSIFPQPVASKAARTLSESSKTFSRFLRGQIIEACILGGLCFASMQVMGLPYALLISTIVGVTALIPILGAFLGAIPGALLLLIDDPINALWFVIMIIILQQIEGNLIYPKVVGNAIGLSGIWVFLAVIVGGSLFGIIGIFVVVPAVAVISAILRAWTNKRLKERNIKIE